MPTKAPTPEQARIFHKAMTGQFDCFADCCLCALQKKYAKIEDDYKWIRDQLMQRLCDCERHEEEVQITLSTGTHDWSCPYRSLFREHHRPFINIWA